jgi:S1-C subfamily serine protease
MDKVLVTQEELGKVTPPPDQPPALSEPLKPEIGWIPRLVMMPLALALPVLGLVTVILRIAFRDKPARTRLAWANLTSSLLIASGLLTSMAAVVVVSTSPVASVYVSQGLVDFDERTSFPTLPSAAQLTGADVAKTLKPLVVVVSPPAKMWFSRQAEPSSSFGAGELLYANSDGYMFVTARHVVSESSLKGKATKAFVAAETGGWSGAEVMATHKDSDLVLLWIKRQNGHGSFAQPLAAAQDGRSIFVIGHPQGLRFTMSTGVVSRLRDSIVQITAPISPGDSGGPVYDEFGNLVAIVTSTMDKAANPNAENLNFAVSSQELTKVTSWDFAKDGQPRFEKYLAEARSQTKTEVVH